MICPFCRSKNTKVVDKRNNDELPVSRRRRECLKCSRRFTTYERLENIDIEVHKKSGRVEPFDRNKLKAGIVRAVRKNVTEAKVDEVVEKIEFELSSRGEKKIDSCEIGTLVMSSLKSLDPLSYLRFASVYKNFRNLKDFEEEIKLLKRDHGSKI